MSQMSRPSAAGSDRSARPPSQSPLSSRMASAALTSSRSSASALASTSPAGQVGLAAARPAIGAVEIRVGPLRRIARHHRDHGVRDGRWVEQDERGRPDPGQRERGGGHPAPAVPDDLEAGHVETGGLDPGRHVRRVVAEAVMTRPVTGQAVAGQVRRRDPVAGGGQRGPDAPPDPRRGGDAMDEHERPRPRVAPGDRGEGDPGRLGRRRLVRTRVGHRQNGRDGRRKVGRMRRDGASWGHRPDGSAATGPPSRYDGCLERRDRRATPRRGAPWPSNSSSS